MVRKGIYVNGKEIVARYVGDKKVWEKESRWTLVKGFSSSGLKFVVDASSVYIAKLETEQFMYGSPPRVLQNERFPDITESKVAQYKLKAPNYESLSGSNEEFFLVLIRITNVPIRHKNHLSIIFSFWSTEDRNRFISLTQQGQFFELYRME